MNEITKEQQAAIAATLKNMTLPAGLGDEHAACSIAAINLALSGKLSDDIPECMSEVIGRWIIVIQDAMPAAIRNSLRWKELLPLAAGTGRLREDQRLTIILDWMWSTVLPSLQPPATKKGFGDEWSRMTTEKTQAAAMASAAAARAAAWAEMAAARAAARAEMAAAADAAAWAAAVAAAAADAAADAAAWDLFDPCGLLQKLVEVDNDQS